jgi:hypothetical protein
VCSAALLAELGGKEVAAALAGEAKGEAVLATDGEVDAAVQVLAGGGGTAGSPGRPSGCRFLAREGLWARGGPQGEQPRALLHGDHQVGRLPAGGRQRHRSTADDQGAPTQPGRHQRQPLEALWLLQL